MHKGMISYKLACIGWDVSDHLGDGYDLLCVKNGDSPLVIQVELKAIDLLSYAEHMMGFSQSLSANEIATASHVVISVFENIQPVAHYIMAVADLFNQVKAKGTSKYTDYRDFNHYRKAASEVALKNAYRKKGQKKEPNRMNIDIGCTFKQYKSKKWILEKYLECWQKLEKKNI